MNTSGADEVSNLIGQLNEATDAARTAYRDSGRVIRLLTVLSSPAPPDQLLSDAMAALAEAFEADLVCVASVVDDRMLVTMAGGPQGEAADQQDWALGPAAAATARTGQAHTRQFHPDDADVPRSLGALGIRSAAFVPMSTSPEQPDEILGLYRCSGAPFANTDLQVLASVAQRLHIAAEDRERAVAIEHLARSGHLLSSSHLDPQLLVDTAAEIMRNLTTSDDAWVMGVSDDVAYQRAHFGTASEETAFKPSRPVTALRAWGAALQGRPWVSTRNSWAGTLPRMAIGIPVMQEGKPIALLYASRNGPRPFSPEVIDIATIFASYLSTALENAGLYRELRQRATRDPLTGLANRELARQQLDKVLDTGTAPYTGLLFCDLDGFKSINDRLGHEAGDELLRHVAQRLQEGLRAKDLLARFGGDEFVVVLDEIQSLSDVTDVGRRLVDSLSEPFNLHDERVTISASIGGVLGVRGQTTAGEMLRDADAAMYVAKARGPGVVEVFDDDASYRSLDRLSIRSDLVGALERGEFHVLYQPIVDLESGLPVGFEALLRWEHPRRGAIPPEVFIPLAEETGEIIPLGFWVLHKACEQLAQWHRLPGWSGLNLHVNVSAAQLWHGDAVGEFMSIMEGTGVSPSDVWLEVSERSHAGEDITGVAKRLRGNGARFALDDFGSSYSNLAYLKQLPVECLKIDRSFINGVAAEGTDRSIVRAILAMAESLGLDVVAEGIEHADQRDALIKLGCRHGQGYLLGEPIAAADTTKSLVR